VHSMASINYRRLGRQIFLLTFPIALISCGLWLDDEARIARARVALDNQQYSAAIIDLKNVLQNTPDNAAARKLLGLALSANGEPEAAEEDLQRALELGQPLEELRVAAADALRSYQQAEELNIDKATALLRAVELYWGAGNLRDAKMFTELALLEDPGNIDGHLTLGAILLDIGNAQAAEETLTSALTTLQLDPVDRGYLLETLIETYLAQGDVGAAREASNQVAELWPAGDPDLQLIEGKVALAEGDNDAAAKELLAYLIKVPDSAAAMRMLGAAQLGRGMVNQARDRLVSALAADPDQVGTRTLLARVYLGEGRFDLAREVLEPALELVDQDPSVLSLLGVVDLPIPPAGLADDLYASVRDRLIRGEIGQALAAALRAVRDHGDDPRAFDLLGLSQLANAKFPAAVESLSYALAAEPDNTRYRSNLAMAQLGNSAPEEGLKVLEGIKTAALDGKVSVIRRALLINLDETNNALGQPDPQPLLRWLSEDPDDAGARLLLAETYIDKGSFALAAAQYEMLLEQGLDDPVLHNNLAWCYLQLSDNRARAQAEYAYELDPNDGAIADTLGWILVSEGDLDNGSFLLRDAHILLPGEPEIAYRLAHVLSRTGAEDEAIALLNGLSELENGPVTESARELLSVLQQAL